VTLRPTKRLTDEQETPTQIPISRKSGKSKRGLAKGIVGQRMVKAAKPAARLRL
jgi:hypothetical protein